jgi:hypothetical protein
VLKIAKHQKTATLPNHGKSGFLHELPRQTAVTSLETTSPTRRRQRDQIIGRDAVETRGGKAISAGHIKEASTTGIIERII